MPTKLGYLALALSRDIPSWLDWGILLWHGAIAMAMEGAKWLVGFQL